MRRIWALCVVFLVMASGPTSAASIYRSGTATWRWLSGASRQFDLDSGVFRLPQSPRVDLARYVECGEGAYNPKNCGSYLSPTGAARISGSLSERPSYQKCRSMDYSGLHEYAGNGWNCIRTGAKRYGRFKVVHFPTMSDDELRVRYVVWAS